jgi:hypothetical protein
MDVKANKTKSLRSFRLSDGTIKAMESLAKRRCITPAKVITVLVKACDSGLFDEDEGVSGKLDDLFNLAKEI